MLDFVIKYRAVVDRMTMRPINCLRAYELDDAAWTMLTQIQEVLEVRVPPEP